MIAKKSSKKTAVKKSDKPQAVLIRKQAPKQIRQEEIIDLKKNFSDLYFNDYDDQEIAKPEIKKPVKTKTTTVKQSLPSRLKELKKEEKKVKNFSARNWAGKLYKKLALIFAGLATILVAVVVYFVMSKAEVYVEIKSADLPMKMSVNISNKSEGQVAGSLAGVVRKLAVELSKDYSPSGEQEIGSEVSGKVTIINNYTKNQPLVATTRLLTSDNKLFRLKESVTVPANGSVQVQVYADKPGEDMVVGEAHFIIPGLWDGLRDKIYAESADGDIVFNKKVKKIIAQTDIDQAEADIKLALNKKINDDLAVNYKDYDQRIFELSEEDTVITTDAKVGEEKDNFKVEIKSNILLAAFNSDKVLALAQEKIKTSLPEGRSALSFDKNALKYSQNKIDPESELAVIDVDFTAQTDIDQGYYEKLINKNSLSGLTRAQVTDYLKGLPEVTGVKIVIHPSIFDSLPSDVSRISVKVIKN